MLCRDEVKLDHTNNKGCIHCASVLLYSVYVMVATEIVFQSFLVVLGFVLFSVFWQYE